MQEVAANQKLFVNLLNQLRQQIKFHFEIPQLTDS